MIGGAGEVAAECVALFREGHHEIVIYRAWRLTPGALTDLMIALTPEERRYALTHWPTELAARAFAALPGEVAPARLLDALDPARVGALVERLPDPVRAPLLAAMTPARREALLGAVRTPGALVRGLDFPTDSVGRLMTTAVVVVTDSDPMPLALESVRRQVREVGERPVIHVVDVGRHLVGLLTFRDLVVAPDGIHVRDAMAPVHQVLAPERSQREGLDLLRRERLEHVPVVDAQGRLLGSLVVGEGGGLVAADQDVAFLQFAGVVGEETRRTGGVAALRSRFLILQANLLAGLVAAFVLETVLSDHTPLRPLIPWVPLIAGLAGISATQALASVQHRLAGRRLPWTRRRAVLRRELLVGLVQGSLGGLLVGGIALLVGPPWVGLTLLVVLLLLLPLVGVVAAAAPMVLRRLGVRAALASMPAMTTVADLLALLMLWGVGSAVWVLRR